MFANLDLTPDQVSKVLSAEDLSGLVSDQALGQDPAKMSTADRIDLAARVLTHAAVCVKKFDQGADHELEILEWNGIFLVYSSTIDWCGPFASETEATDFLRRMDGDPCARGV